MIKNIFSASLFIASVLLPLIPSLASAQRLVIPGFTGFTDMAIETRCTTSNSTADIGGTAVLPVVHTNGITINFETGGLRQTVDLFTSHPHIVKIPSSVTIGDGQENQIRVDIEQVTEPTMIMISARVNNRLFPGFDDEDMIMVYPRFNIESVTLSPEKTLYRVGEKVTATVKTTYPFPDNLLEPFGTQPRTGSVTDPEYMVGPDWYNPWERFWRVDNNNEQGFDYSFTVQWPNNYIIPDYSANFEFNVGYVRPPFCAFFGSYSRQMNIQVKNPHFSIKPLPVIEPPKIELIKK